MLLVLQRLARSRGTSCDSTCGLLLHVFLSLDVRLKIHVELRCENVFVGQGPPHLGVMRNAFTETPRSLFGSLLRRVHLVEPQKTPDLQPQKTLLSALPVQEASGNADCPDPSGSFRPNANVGKSSAGHLGTLHHAGSRQRPWPSKKLASLTVHKLLRQQGARRINSIGWVSLKSQGTDHHLRPRRPSVQPDIFTLSTPVKQQQGPRILKFTRQDDLEDEGG